MNRGSRVVLLAVLLLLSGLRAPQAQNLFWESPALKSATGVSYSTSAATDDLIVLTWQERTGSGASSAVSIYADVAHLDAPGADTRWSGKRLVHGPIALAGVGEEGRMHAVAADGDRVLVAILLYDATGAGPPTILFKSSGDGGLTFTEVARIRAPVNVTSPSLSRTADGGWLLLITQTEQIVGGEGQRTLGKLSIASSRSSDGVTWSPLVPLVTEATLTQNIQPFHVVVGSADYLVFQSTRTNDHLYLKRSTDGGRSWPGDSILLTGGAGFAESFGGKARTADEFNNQRPVAAAKDGRIAVAWERALVGSDQYQIYYAEFDTDGKVLLPKESVPRTGSARFAEMLPVGGGLRLLYTEKQLGRSRLLLASRSTSDGSAVWSAIPVAPSLQVTDLIPHGGVLGDRIYGFAEVPAAGGEWALYAIRPDTSAPAPVLRPDFAPRAPTNRTRVGVRWDEPPDASRIAGYRYAWTPAGAESAQVALEGASQQLGLDATSDGDWTLAVWSVDRAGNVSREPAKVTFRRDTLPPDAVTLLLDPAPDLDGYQPSNDFTITYVEPPGDTIGRFEVTRDLPDEGGRVDYLAGGLRAVNVSDGEHAVTVRAVDLAGNIGPPSTIVLRLNRYRPVTRIARVEESTDADQNLVLRVVGIGFAVGGAVSEVYLDADKQAPYDQVFRLSERTFAVPDDRHLTGVTLGSEIDSGLYYLGVRHPARGVAWAGRQVDFSAPGTIKVGDFRFRWAPRWAAARSSRLHVPFVAMLVVLAAGMLAVLFTITSRRAVAVAREGVALRSEIRALLDGRPSPLLIRETERKLRTLRRRGVGLRVKFSLLVSVLAILIVAILAVPLGLQMISRERRILAEELQSRTTLLLDSAAARAVSPLRIGAAGLATLANIPDSITAMPDEALSITITGPSSLGATDPVDRDYLWASNDREWPQASYVPGRRPMEDVDLPGETVRRIGIDLNTEAVAGLRGVLEEYRTLEARAGDLARRSIAAGATEADRAASQAAQDELRRLRDGAQTQIQAIAKKDTHAGSLPVFDPDRLQGSYLFYRPIATFDLDGSFFLGMVRLRVSTGRINRDIEDATRSLVNTLAVIAIAAIGLGIIGATILAGIIIRPVRVLAAGVARIRDTDPEDIKGLEGVEIDVKARDETGTLAAAVNEMTRGLVKAAKDKEELRFGKSLQKQFIPLSVGPDGEKGSLAAIRGPGVEICGYYEGAKGVSGDYFDVHQLDQQHWAIINCDVAGKGVAAAMIMVEVATLFIGWCNDWKSRAARGGGRAPDDLRQLVYLVNDMLEERGFKGRFAALTVALLDSATGALDVCTAGNNVLHVFDAASREMRTRPLPQTPAAGSFPTDIVRLKSDFPQVRITLAKADALFLFTDGFEESKRTFRTWTGEEVPCREPGLAEKEPHDDSHTLGQTNEEFSLHRIRGVVDAVFGRGRYELARSHTPVREDLAFDFSTCAGTVEEAVLALVGVEKVYRLYRDPLTGPSDRVSVDAKVDMFLAQHFLQHGEWFSHRVEGGKSGEPVVYTHLKEDQQYDDLTLLVVRRP